MRIQLATLLLAVPWAVQATNVDIGCSNGAGDRAGFISAINAANASGGGTITLSAGCIYSFNNADNYWFGPNALPPIQAPISIEGHGATLQALHIGDPTPATADAFRFFYVSGGLESPAGSLTLHNVTLRGGYAKGGDSYYGGDGAGMGGAIFNHGILNLAAVTLVGNSAQGGNTNQSVGNSSGGGGIGQDAQGITDGGGFGGINLPGAFQTSSVGGSASSIGGGGGAGFLISDNGKSADSGANGGGIGRTGGSGGSGGSINGYSPPWFDSSTVNDGGNGGYAFGANGINGAGGDFGAGGHGSSTYPDNGGGGGGGGVGGGGGGGAYAGAGGGGFGGGGGSGFFAGNGGFGAGGAVGGDNTVFGGFGGGYGGSDVCCYVGGGGAGLGGAIFNHAGTVNLTNVTMIANAAKGGTGSAPGSGLGGAIFNLNGSVELSFSTIARNSIVGSNGVYYNNGPGDGAIYSLAYGNRIQDGSASFASLILANSIVYGTAGAENEVVNNSVDGQNPNVAEIAFVESNIVTAYSNASFLHPSSTVPLSLDPQLGSLSHSVSGSTPDTLPIPMTSPAHDAALSCTDVHGSPVTSDERGVARPQYAQCDIGAYEYDGDYVFANDFE